MDTKKILSLLKSMAASYVITIILLLLVSFVLFKLKLNKNEVNIAVIAVYIISCAVGGFIMGKIVKEKRLIWGIALGAVYFIILAAVSVILNHQITSPAKELVTTLIMCITSGGIGGVIS